MGRVLAITAAILLTSQKPPEPRESAGNDGDLRPQHAMTKPQPAHRPMVPDKASPIIPVRSSCGH